MWSEINGQEVDKDLMWMLDLNETIDQLAKAYSVHWYGHVLRRDKKNFLRRALDIAVKGTRKRGRPMKTWLRVVVILSRKVLLNKGDVDNRSRWRLGVNTIYRMMRYIQLPLLFGGKTGFMKS